MSAGSSWSRGRGFAAIDHCAGQINKVRITRSSCIAAEFAKPSLSNDDGNHRISTGELLPRVELWQLSEGAQQALTELVENAVRRALEAQGLKRPTTPSGSQDAHRACGAGNDPELVKALREARKMAKRLRRDSPKTGERRSLRKISVLLAAAGYLNERGQPINPNSIKLMLEG
jgi:hypothetical protein